MGAGTDGAQDEPGSNPAFDGGCSDLSQGRRERRRRKPGQRRTPPARAAPVRLTAGQRYIRGLYSGGTFCYEAINPVFVI